MFHKKDSLDQDYLIHTYELLLKENQELIPYIKDVKFVHSEEEFAGSYSNSKREIIINQQALERIKGQKHLYGLEVIKHEMEHARNLMTLENPHQDIESLAINYSLKDYAIRNELDWHHNIDCLEPNLLHFRIQKNYEVNPGERIVEIKAWKYIVNLLKNQRTSKDLLTARIMLYYSYIRGYQDNRYYLECPTYQFLLNTGMYHELYWLKNRVKSKDYCLQTRLTYGLPITSEEHENKVLQKVHLRKAIR